MITTIITMYHCFHHMITTFINTTIIIVGILGKKCPAIVFVGP